MPILATAINLLDFTYLVAKFLNSPHEMHLIYADFSRVC